MDENYKIVTVNENNIADYPQVICFINPKHKHFHHKVDWLKDRFKEGLTIKLIYIKGEKKPAGFIEYTRGEYAWRAVSAKGYMFIHCIWVTPIKNKNKEYGSILLNECFEHAKREDLLGVATLASSDAFMAGKDLFVKNGFSIIDSAVPSFDLLVKPIKDGHLPKINNFQKELISYQGLHIIYSNQCPWVARFVKEIDESAKLNGLNISIKEITTPLEAQNAPSPYSVFNLIYNGRILADHYISETRFINILKKEKLI